MWWYFCFLFFFQSILCTCVQQIQTMCFHWWFHYRLQHKATNLFMVSSVRWQGCTVHKPTSHGFWKNLIFYTCLQSLKVHGCMNIGLTRAIWMRNCTVILQIGAFTYGSMRQCWKVNYYLLLWHIFILLCPYSWCVECFSYQWQLGDFSDLLHKVTALL